MLCKECFLVKMLSLVKRKELFEGLRTVVVLIHWEDESKAGGLDPSAIAANVSSCPICFFFLLIHSSFSREIPSLDHHHATNR